MKKLIESVLNVLLREDYEDKLARDVQSLKRIGWTLDKISKHLVISKDYGDVKITSDKIKDIFKGPKKVIKKKIKPLKPTPWPKDPKGSKTKDPVYAENWFAQAVRAEMDSGGSPDWSPSEVVQVMTTAGFEDEVIRRLLKNMDMPHPDDRAKRKGPRKFAKSQGRIKRTRP